MVPFNLFPQFHSDINEHLPLREEAPAHSSWHYVKERGTSKIAQIWAFFDIFTHSQVIHSFPKNKLDTLLIGGMIREWWE